MPSLTRVAVISLFMMIITKLLNIIRDGCIAYTFGTSNIIDAYVVSESVPLILISITIGGFSEAYIPCYTRVTPNKRHYFFCNVMVNLVLLSTVIGVICWFFSDYVAELLISDNSMQTLSLVSKFIKLSIIVFPFLAVFYVLSAQSQSLELFLIQRFCNSILLVSVLLIAAFCANEQHPEILIYGDICSIVFAVLLLGWYLCRVKQIKISIAFNPFDCDFIRLFKLAIPLGACLFIDRINITVDRWFASGLGGGIVSGLNYADKIQNIPLSISITMLFSICFPRLSKAFSLNDMEQVFYYIKNAVGMTLYFTVPMTVWFCFYPEVFVTLLYGRGAFAERSIEITSIFLSFYSIGMLFYSLRSIAAKILSAMMLQQYIFYNTALALILNIVFNYTFINLIGFGGIAISSTLTGLITLIFMLKTLYDKNIRFWDKSLTKDSVKIMGISILTMVIWELLNSVTVITGGLVDILVKGVVIVAMYLVMSYFTRIETFIWSVQRIRNTISRK